MDIVIELVGLITVAIIGLWYARNAIAEAYGEDEKDEDNE